MATNQVQAIVSSATPYAFVTSSGFSITLAVEKTIAVAAVAISAVTASIVAGTFALIAGATNFIDAGEKYAKLSRENASLEEKSVVILSGVQNFTFMHVGAMFVAMTVSSLFTTGAALAVGAGIALALPVIGLVCFTAGAIHSTYNLAKHAYFRHLLNGMDESDITGVWLELQLLEGKIPEELRDQIQALIKESLDMADPLSEVDINTIKTASTHHIAKFTLMLLASLVGVATMICMLIFPPTGAIVQGLFLTVGIIMLAAHYKSVYESIVSGIAKVGEFVNEVKSEINTYLD